MTIYTLEKELIDLLNDNKEEALDKDNESFEEAVHPFIDQVVPTYNADLLDVCQSKLELGYADENRSPNLSQHTDIYSVLTWNIYNHLLETAHEWEHEQTKNT